MWVLYFRQVSDLPVILQNQNGRNDFFKNDPKLGNNRTQLEEIFDV